MKMRNPSKIDPRLMREMEGPISIVLRLYVDSTQKQIETLERLGMRIDGQSKRIISGSIPAPTLTQLGELEFVQSIERPQRYRLV
jgi:hypothetical protein